jgi:stage IV sporulation protein FB
VITSEPPPTPYDLRFRLLGVPVRVHPLFWLVALLLGLSGNQQAMPMLLWVGAVFVSILVHELGHALTARAFGWQPWIPLHGFGGLASYRPTHRSPRAQILISLAGPSAGFLFAVLILGAIAASGHFAGFVWGESLLPFQIVPFKSPNLNNLIVDLMVVNIFWGLINLLPVLPLDGGRVAQEVFQLFNPDDGLRQALWLSVVVGGGVAVLSFLRFQEFFIALLFAYMAYGSYMTLQAYYGRGGGMGGYR